MADTERYKITGMDCGSCALTIENGMRQLDGVREVSVSFTTESMQISGSAARPEIEKRLRELGYRLAESSATRDGLAERRGLTGFLRFIAHQRHLRWAAIATLIVLAATPPLMVRNPPLLGLLYAITVVAIGAPIFLKGFRALFFARRITIDLLMAIASSGALLIGASGEAVAVILLYTLGEALEAYSAERARESLRSLLALQPLEATVMREHRGEHGHGHGHGHDHGHAADAHFHATVIPADQVALGDLVLVRPGQRVPVDGVVLRGTTSIDQAAVTGESVPVARGPGDEVMAGTVNGDGAIEIETRALARESTIARIAKLVEQAQSQRSPAERFIDRFARWYTPLVIALAALVVAIPVVVFGQPLLDSASGEHGWLYRGLALLIVACPCALVISIPVTVVSALTRLAHLGVLVKGGAQLDVLAAVKVIAFDKTGTLTRGRPAVTAIRSADCEHPDDHARGCTPCDDVVTIAASVEASSEHPVAHAIVAEARHRRPGLALRAHSVTAHAGRGVTGELAGGQKIAVGSDALFATGAAGRDVLASTAARLQHAGNTLMYVARDEQIIGYIGVQDEVRDTSRAAFAALKRDQPDIRTVMLTGDNAQVAHRVAAQIPGIDAVHAALLPQGKLDAIERLRAHHGVVAMVGDGINDAPALARADVGIAMGHGGTAQAMETADVVLMRDDLSQIPAALRISRRSRALVKQNIALSLGLKLAFLALAIPGITTLWLAVVADVGATLLVTLNGMRLLRET